MKQPAFPYMASLSSIADPIIDAITRLNQRVSRIVDPMCGSAVIPYHLSKALDVPVLLAEGNAYAALNAEAIFCCPDLPTTVPDVPPTRGKLWDSLFGHWSSLYRATIDGILEQAIPSRVFAAAVGRALLSATFRGQSWCDVRADGVDVRLTTGEGARTDVVNALRTMRRKSLYRKHNRVDWTDWETCVSGVKWNDVVILDPPWAWPGAIDKNPFAFYDDLNFVLTGSSISAKFTHNTQTFYDTINFCRRHGATVIAFKQSHTTPEDRPLRDFLGKPSLILPLRGRGKVTQQYPQAREEIWICRP